MEEIFIDPAGVEYAKALASMQQMFFDLDDDVMGTAKELFAKTMVDKPSVRRMAQYFYIACLIRSKDMNLYMDLFDYFMSIRCENELIEELPEMFVALVFKPLVSKIEFMEKAGPLAFCRQLMDRGYLEANVIVTRISVFRERYPKHRNMHLLLFAWFAPEIESCDSVWFEKTMEDFDTKGLLPMLPMALREFVRNIALYRENNWEIYKKITIYPYVEGSIEYALAKDDVTALEIFLRSSDFDIDARISESVFETHWTLQNRPSLIQFSAFWCSIKCFKMLLIHGARLEEHDYHRIPTAHIAIAGGGLEIVRIVDQQRVTFAGALQEAALFHHQDVMNWICESKGINIHEDDFTYGPPLHRSMKTENIEALLLALTEKVDVNTRDRNKRTLLFMCTYEDHPELVNLLFNHKDIDINLMAAKHISPLSNACKYGSVEVVKLLCERKEIDVNAPSVSLSLTRFLLCS